MEEQKEKVQEKRKKINCSACGSSFVYVRIKEGSVVCRSCGNIDPLED